MSEDEQKLVDELQAAAKDTPLEQHLVGELIASEVEIRTGRCANFEDAAALLGERRSQLYDLAEPLGIALAATGTHPWSPWYLPELLALSASSPFVEGVNTGLHSARTQIFTRMFPRCGVPDAYDGWDGFERYVRFLYDTGSIEEHTQIWWSVRPHLAFPTIEIRICDAQPDLAEARSLAAFCYALAVRITHALDEGEPLPDYPHRLIEENFWRAIRHGLSGELIDLETGETGPARSHLERLLEWIQPAAEEIGAAPYLGIPSATAAERQIARHESGATLEEIYAEQVKTGVPVV